MSEVAKIEDGMPEFEIIFENKISCTRTIHAKDEDEAWKLAQEIVDKMYSVDQVVVRGQEVEDLDEEDAEGWEVESVGEV